MNSENLAIEDLKPSQVKSELKVESWKVKNLAIEDLKPNEKNEKLKIKNEKWIESWKLKIEKP